MATSRRLSAKSGAISGSSKAQNSSQTALGLRAAWRDAQQEVRSAVKSHPELTSTYLSLSAAQEIAERRIADPKDCERFVALVRDAIAASIKDGAPLPAVKLREPARDNARAAPIAASRARRRRAQSERIAAIIPPDPGVAVNNHLIDERGYFWWSNELVPEKQFAPNSAVPGTLKIDVEGRVELELDGIMPNKDGPFAVLLNNGMPQPPDVGICGILKNSNKFVTLLEISKNGGHFTTGGISYEKYLALSALVGSDAFRQGDMPLRFRNLRMELTGFEEWLRLGGIETKRTRQSIAAKYKALKNVSYPLEDGTLSIRYGMSGPFPGKSRSDQLKLTESATIQYVAKKTMPLEEMKTQYGLLADLLLLLTGSDYAPGRPVLTHTKSKKSYQLFFMRNASASEAPRYYDCWTNFPQLKQHFGRIFYTFRMRREELGPGIYLYLGTRRAMKLYVEHEFVNLMWGIESLHRRKSLKSRTPSPLELKIERIVDQIADKGDKKWLTYQLKHAGEPSLQERMFDILKALPFGLNESALRKFCGDCAAKRNDISHFGGQRHSGNYRDFVIDLNKKSEALAYLYHAVLLQEIGVDPGILNHFVYQGFRSFSVKASFVTVGLLPKSALDQPRDPSARGAMNDSGAAAG